METAQILSIAGGIIVFLGGLVLAGIRATLTTIKKDIEKLYEIHAKIRHDFDLLCGEHNTMKDDHGKRRR